MKVYNTGCERLDRTFRESEESHGLYLRRIKEEAMRDTSERQIDVLVSDKTSARPTRCWKRMRDGARKACKRLRSERDAYRDLALRYEKFTRNLGW